MEKDNLKNKTTTNDDAAVVHSSSVISTAPASELELIPSAACSVVGHAPSHLSATPAGVIAEQKSAFVADDMKISLLAPRPTLSEQDSCLESTDSLDSESLCGDKISVISEKSGCTDIGSDLKKLDLKSGFVKMTSAEKRRFKQALASGQPREKALQIAKSASAAKRMRSEESAKDVPVGKKTKVSPHSTKPTYSQVAGMVRLGVVPVDLGASPLTREQMVLIQEAVIDVMIEVNDSNKPVFEGSVHRNGWLLFLCSNDNTVKWMKSNFDQIKKKCGLEMALVGENEFPKTNVVRGFFPQSTELSNEKILATIRAQNNLSANHWKVLQRTTEGGLVHLVLTVEDESLSKLSETKGKIAYRFGHVRLILKANKADNEKEAVERTVDTLQVVPAATTNTAKHAEDTRSDVGDIEKPSTSKAALERQNALKVPTRAKTLSRGTKVQPKSRHTHAGERRDRPNKGPRSTRLQKLVEENHNK